MKVDTVLARNYTRAPAFEQCEDIFECLYDEIGITEDDLDDLECLGVQRVVNVNRDGSRDYAEVPVYVYKDKEQLSDDFIIILFSDYQKHYEVE